MFTCSKCGAVVMSSDEFRYHLLSVHAMDVPRLSTSSFSVPFDTFSSEPMTTTSTVRVNPIYELGGGPLEATLGGMSMPKLTIKSETPASDKIKWTINKSKIMARHQHPEGTQYGNVDHQVSLSTVLNYLAKNPTFDKRKAPLKLSNSYYGADYCKSRPANDQWGRPAYTEADHTVPWDVLKKFINANETIKAIRGGEKLIETVEKTVIREVVVEKEFGLDDRGLLEIWDALRRQQHVRNEYIRRAYEAGDEEAIARELAAMKVLTNVMDTIGMKLDDWKANASALAELTVIEREEVTHDLHPDDLRSDGAGGLERSAAEPVALGSGASPTRS